MSTQKSLGFRVCFGVRILGFVDGVFCQSTGAFKGTEPKTSENGVHLEFVARRTVTSCPK